MVLTTCPHCGQSIAGDPLADEIARLHAWCQSQNIYPARGDLLRVEQAAKYLGRESKTLRNWLSVGTLHATKIRKRAFISIPDLAAVALEK